MMMLRIDQVPQSGDSLGVCGVHDVPDVDGVRDDHLGSELLVRVRVERGLVVSLQCCWVHSP